jgi:hypothetical protein
MSNRDVWSFGTPTGPRDLVCSSLIALRLSQASLDQPAWFCSALISDFILFDNRLGQVSALYPDLADADGILFTQFLADLSRRRPTRVVAPRTESSIAFAGNPHLRGSAVEVRFCERGSQREGILTPGFYIEGSINLTAAGIFVRGEKVALHVPDDDTGRAKCSAASLEFQRQWDHLPAGEAR